MPPFSADRDHPLWDIEGDFPLKIWNLDETLNELTHICKKFGHHRLK